MKEIKKDLLIILVSLILTSIMIVKIIFLSYYGWIENAENIYFINEYTKNIKFGYPIKVVNRVVPDDDYISFDDIKIKLNETDYEKRVESDNLDTIYYKNKTKQSGIIISRSESIISFLKNHNFDKINKKFINNFLIKNKIENDGQIYQYLNGKKINYLTPIKEMNIMEVLLISINATTPIVGDHNAGTFKLIEGDKTGYIIEHDENISINIIKDNNNYELLLIKKELFTDVEILELLETMIV